MKGNGLRARSRRRGLPKDDGARPSSPATFWRGSSKRVLLIPSGWRTSRTWTAEGWLLVAAVLDLFSRRIVGWPMKTEWVATLVTDAVMMALWRRGKADALLYHSD